MNVYPIQVLFKSVVMMKFLLFVTCTSWDEILLASLPPTAEADRGFAEAWRHLLYTWSFNKERSRQQISLPWTEMKLYPTGR